MLNVREANRRQSTPPSPDDFDMSTAAYRAINQRDGDCYGTDDDTLELKEARKSSIQTDESPSPSFERRPLAC